MHPQAYGLKFCELQSETYIWRVHLLCLKLHCQIVNLVNSYMDDISHITCNPVECSAMYKSLYSKESNKSHSREFSYTTSLSGYKKTVLTVMTVCIMD